MKETELTLNLMQPLSVLGPASIIGGGMKTISYKLSNCLTETIQTIPHFDKHEKDSLGK